MNFTYHLLNVFGHESTAFSGNPLCVVEPGPAFSDADMQAIARQFNLSETVFIGPSTVADADVRIFTPESELPFAGHPTLGTAFFVARLKESVGEEEHGEAEIRLNMPAGIIPVNIRGTLCTLTAKAPVCRPASCDDSTLAAAFGLNESDLGTGVLAGGTMWINTGTEQLIVPVRTEEAVHRAQPDYARLCAIGGGHANVHALVFSMSAAHQVTARFFFAVQGALREDPATGSASANLGGWWLRNRGALPFHAEVRQGDAVFRPSRLYLEVLGDERIRVAGRVSYLGRGKIDLADQPVSRPDQVAGTIR
jgi:PhzF family phenazine biosynthesis protein